MFDADNHYYEAEDAFTRYASDRMRAERFVRWLAEGDGKRRRLFFGAREANVIGNPTFNPITRPGVFHDTLKNLEAGLDRSRACLRRARRPSTPRTVTGTPALRPWTAKAWRRPCSSPPSASPSRGSSATTPTCSTSASTRSTAGWTTTGASTTRDRIYAAPYLSLLDLDRAVDELEWVLDRGARIITIRPGPAYGRSPADPHFDPFWARIEEAGVLVTYHALEGPSTYTEQYRQLWAAPPAPLTPEARLLQHALAGIDTAIMDTLCALVLHNLFGRFPNLHVATIELGCGWVPFLLHRLDHVGGLVDRRISAFGMPLTRAAVGDLPPARVGLAVPRGGHRAPRRPHRRRADAHGVGLAPRRRDGRAGRLPQGPDRVR